MGKISAANNLVFMKRSSSFKKKGFFILCVPLFLVTIFSLGSCSSKKQPLLSACLTAEEKKDLDFFFRLLIFENYGAFVLFGSKPLCEMFISDTECTAGDEAFQQWFDSLPEQKKAEIKAKIKNKVEDDPVYERNPYRGWLAWEKVQKKIEMKHYILRIAPLRGPSGYEVMLANTERTALTMQENYEIFREASGMEFQPFQVIRELINPNALFWKNIFSLPNHLAKGLLFGFGLKNSQLGHQRFSHHLEKDSTEHIVSTTRVEFGSGSPSNFNIPLFGTVLGDETIEKYKKEKVEIEKIYEGKDLVEVTLRRLAS